jgi:hypothetical protein
MLSGNVKFTQNLFYFSFRVWQRIVDGDSFQWIRFAVDENALTTISNQYAGLVALDYGDFTTTIPQKIPFFFFCKPLKK